MTRTEKELTVFFFILLPTIPIMFGIEDRIEREAAYSVQYQKVQIENEQQEGAEKIHTYYINVGGHSAAGCHDYTAYPSYSFNTETGEWSDGGNYVVHGDELCEVNKYGERTRIGYIIAYEYGDRLINNYCG